MNKNRLSDSFIISAIIIVSLIALVVFIVLMGVDARKTLLAQYNAGVQYYENGDYLEASKVFLGLKGWGQGLVEISPEEYFSMSLDALEVSNPEMIVCRNCGEVIGLGVAVE